MSDILSQLSASNVTPPSYDPSTTPDYLIGADSHNYGNGNFSLLDPTTYSEGLADVGKFIVGAGVSGLSSIYNTGVTVSNWLGNDATPIDPGNVLHNLDDDLGTYYDQNRTAEDLVGFLATSLIPGTAGIKVLNAGQKMLALTKEGVMGANMARTLGLLPSAAETLAARSAGEIAASAAQYSAINATTTQALISGIGQNILEGAAFETAVQATMSQSPILQGQDGLDIAKNVLTGGLLQGAIGGVFSAAKIFGTIRKTVSAADEALAPSRFINELPAASAPADRIAQRIQDLTDIPTFTSLDDFTQNYLSKFPNLENADPAALYNRFQQNVVSKTNKLNLLMKEDLSQIVGKDSEMIESLGNTLTKLPADQAQLSLDGLMEAGRITSPLKNEQLILDQNIAKGPIDPNAPLQTVNKSLNYVKLWGDDAGKVSNLRPVSPGLADQLPNAAAVRSRVASYAFDAAKPVNIAAVDTNTADARYIWAKTQTLQSGATVGENDIPLLEQAYLQKLPVVKVAGANGVETITSSQDLLAKIKQVKEETALKLLADGKPVPEIARATNLSENYLSHTASTDPTRDLFARQTVAQDYTKDLVQRGLWTDAKGVYDLDTTPQYLKTVYDLRKVQDVNGNVVQGMSRIKMQQSLIQQAMDNVFSKQTGALDSSGALTNRFWHPGDDLLLKANRAGAGPGLFKFANGGYGSLASWAESIGSATYELGKQAKQAVRTELEPVLAKLYAKPQAAIEFSAINEELAATSEKYILNDAGDGLTIRSLKQYRDAIAAGENPNPPVIQQGARTDIPIQNPETLDAIKTHIRVNGQTNTSLKEIRAVMGLEHNRDASTFYPIKPDVKEYPHFAFVVDPTVTGAGHMKMIHATSAKDLQQLIDRVPEPFKVFTKQDTADYFRAKNEYEWDRGLHENYVDSTIQSRGINSQFFPQTDPQTIVNKILNFHLKGQDVLSRELVSGKFDTEFSELSRLGEQFSSLTNSKYASKYQDLADITKNPYLSYLKTALNISQTSEIPLLASINKVLDATVSKAFNGIGAALGSVKNTADLDSVNQTMQQYGIKTAYYDAGLNYFVNKGADSGALRTFIGRANGLLGSLAIGLDPISHLNNAIGHQVLLGTETAQLTRAIGNADTNIAGALGNLTKINVPGVSDSITSPGRLIYNSIRNYFAGDTAAGLSRADLISQYQGMGILRDLTSQFHSVLDDLTLKGTEGGVDLGKRLDQALAKAHSINALGQKYAGGNLSEEFQGFIAADVMRQLTDLGVKGGVISSDEARSYIQTFVNRVRGNLIASQRPLMFQGPIGQAVSLFQTYQFNMLQQLMRYAGEGSAKDVAMLLGLQGTLYGMSSLPAFNFINQHIIGTASGNPQHRDLYDATYGVLGKNMGDWLMYGVPSKMLNLNLYTRGDLNPRSLTIIPTNPADVPLFSAYGKFFGNLKQMASNISSGAGVWNSFLSGVEHNGISRPLAGLAQVLQGGSTNAKGALIGSNDLMSMATLARLSGGRPLDEAITNDAMYRVTSYQAADREKQQNLSQALRIATENGGMPDGDQMNKFIADYVAAGGTPTNFSRFMTHQILAANTPAANLMIQHLKSPMSQSLQGIMGGSIDTGFATPSGNTAQTMTNPFQ